MERENFLDEKYREINKYKEMLGLDKENFSNSVQAILEICDEIVFYIQSGTKYSSNKSDKDNKKDKHSKSNIKDKKEENKNKKQHKEKDKNKKENKDKYKEKDKNKGENKKKCKQLFSIEELKKFDGKNGENAYIAVDGRVYDVTDNKKWKCGNHYGIKAGNDVSDYFKSCHKSEKKILKKMKPIGYLE